MISIDVKNAKEISKMFADFGKEGSKAFQEALFTTALEGASAAQKKCPVDTGRLRSSIHAENKKTKTFTYRGKKASYNGKLYVMLGDLDACFGTNVEYAESVNNGHKEYKIKPKNGKVLAWLSPIGMNINNRKFIYNSKSGRTTQNKKNALYSFATEVTIPAKSGVHYMEEGAKVTEMNIDKNVLTALDKLFKNAKS